MASLGLVSWLAVCLVSQLLAQAEETTDSNSQDADKKASSTDWNLLSDAFAGGGTAANKSKLSEDVESPLDTCPGDPREKHKCAHEGYRICMRLMDGDKPYIFGDPDKRNATELEEDINNDGLDWWEWSKQPDNKSAWMQTILDQGGHHWCTCALCTSEAVDRFGCDSLDIICPSSDVNFIRHRVEKKGKMYLKSALECLESKCGKDYQEGFPIIGEDCGELGCAYDAEIPVLWHKSTSATLTAASAFMLIFVSGAFCIARRSKPIDLDLPRAELKDHEQDTMHSPSSSIAARDVIDVESETSFAE